MDIRNMVVKGLVIVAHYAKFDDITFLRTCVHQLITHQHPDIDVTICVVDQCEEHIKTKVKLLESDEHNVVVLDCVGIDAGYPIDFALAHFKNDGFDYVCTLDADAFVLNNGYFHLPVQLIEKFGYSYVGHSTNFAHHCYCPKMDDEWMHINNYYRVSSYAHALECSEAVGFMRVHNRARLPVPRDFIETKFEKTIDWCDNGVVAQWYAKQIDQGPKLTLALRSGAGVGKNGLYGMNIENMVFHVVFGFTEIDVGTSDYYEEAIDEKIRTFHAKLRHHDIIPEESIWDIIRCSDKRMDPRLVRFDTEISSEQNKFIDEYLARLKK